jgi:signal transduction histidine kinase
MSLPYSDERSTFEADINLPGPESPYRVPARWESWAVAFAAACAIFTITGVLQWFVYVYLLGHDELHYVGTSIAALLTFGFIQRMMAASRQRRVATRRRFEVVAEMNHHIRNSLQTILYQSYTLDDDVAARLKDAVDRIQWVLERVVPAMDDDGGKRRKPEDDSSERAA